QEGTVETAGNVACEPDDFGSSLLAGLTVASLRMPGDEFAGEIDDGCLDYVVVAEIESDNVPRIGLHAQQRGRLAGTGDCLATDFGDQTVGDQLCSDRRNSCGREPAVAGEVGAALRTVGVEGLQEQGAIAWTSVSGGRFRRRRRTAIG